MTRSAARSRKALAAVPLAVFLLPLASSRAMAADDLPLPAAPVPPTEESSPPPAPRPEQGRPAAVSSRAALLINEAFDLANSDNEARINAVRGAAALLPRLPASDRERLYSRWQSLAFSPSVPRSLRLSALSAFFDVASRTDAGFAREKAILLPDSAGRAGAFLELARAAYPSNFTLANADSQRALQAARREGSPMVKARALTFAAVYIAGLNPATRRAAVSEASSAVRRLPAGRARDSLMAEVVGATAKFDLGLARSMTSAIADVRLRGLANARVNISEVSQTTLTGTSQDRITALAQAAAPYDTRAIPVLLGLPPQESVYKALGAALPPIYPTASPQIDASLLERLWDYSVRAQPSVFRDQLQSRLARLMVLQDPWRGREWGKRLAWQGGRIQVGAFLKTVLEARVAASMRRRNSPPSVRTQLANLPDVSERSVNTALDQARQLPPAAQVEALLLIAGQLLA